MRNFFMVLSLVLGLAFVTGCNGDAANVIDSAYEKGGEYLVKVASASLNGECRRSLERRKELVTDINARQIANGKTPRAVAQDCNGDGEPDFTLPE